MNIRKNYRIVSLNDKGLPDIEGRPSVGDLYLTPSLTDPEMYDEWIWAGETLEWQKFGMIVPYLDDESDVRKRRVENVKKYFRERKGASK